MAITVDPVRRGWPLRRHLIGLVTLFLVTAMASGVFGWVQAERAAMRSAGDDAAFAARLAAAQLDKDFAAATAAVAQLAANPRIADVFKATDGCTLSFAAPGASHLDVVTPDGTVACSSRPVGGTERTAYAGAAWLPGAAQAPMVQAPVPDPRTGHAAVLLTAPIQGGGSIAALIDLQGLGPSLSALFGGPRALEFLVTTGGSATVLTRSADPARWIGTAVTATPFRAAGPVQRRDVTGTRRLYGQAAVTGTGWTVYAGADRRATLATVRRAYQRQSYVLFGGLLIAFAATLLVYRRITRPIRRLSGAVRAASAGPAATVAITGPREVAGLANEFNGLLRAVDTELSERRRAEESAREHEQNYRQLFDANPYPMFVVDAETLALLEANDAAVAHYGYPREELLDCRLTDLCPPEHGAALAESVAAPPAGPVGPVPQVTKDGNLIDVQITFHALSFAGREARGAVIEDVTAKERLERRLRQSERLESLGQLAGGVAHDFNNLLSIIVGYAGMATAEVSAAAENDPRWDPVRDDLTQVLGAVDRATTLTRQLLSFARADLVQPTVLDLNAVIGDIEPLLRRTLGEDIDLRTDLGDDLRAVCADAGQLEQVLVNLAVNARDAMPTGGTLVIDTDNLSADNHYAAHHPGTTAGEYVRVRVSDTGSGMSQATIDRAFEPFFTTKPKGQGTGLGLATIYGIVTQAGGTVHIYSEPGIGTTITALLPATTRSAAADGPASDEIIPGRGETILVVEDEVHLRGLTERILRRHNYDVITAEDGVEAVALAADRPDIDLLLTDVVMPNMAGHDLANRLRESHSGMPVVYVSGYAEPILTTHKTLPRGVTLLTKPVTEPLLLRAIRDALEAAADTVVEPAARAGASPRA